MTFTANCPRCTNVVTARIVWDPTATAAAVAYRLTCGHTTLVLAD